MSLAGGTSSTRGGVLRAASSPVSAAGWVAQHLPTCVDPPESAEDGMGRHSSGPGRRGGRHIPRSLPVAFPRNTPWFPKAGHGSCTGTPQPCPASVLPALRYGSSQNHPGEGTRGSCWGAPLPCIQRESLSPRFIPFPFQPPMPTSPSPFRSSRVVCLDHRPPKLLEL